MLKLVTESTSNYFYYLEKRKGHLLPVIVFSQFAGTSLWFAGNAIIQDIQLENSGNTANITSIVQLGFIAGTLVFALLTIADRFRSTIVFFISSILAAMSNLGMVWFADHTAILMTLRFITGFFLAGIYPVGMKIAAERFPQQVGRALGFLVGALVLGTASPHIIRSQLRAFSWAGVVIFTSVLAAMGGLIVLLLLGKEEAHKKSTGIKLNTAFKVFGSANFRSAAFGYFGHMWELYAYWAFVPLVIGLYNQTNSSSIDVSFWSFMIIAIGALGCVAGGILSKKTGSKKVAFYALVLSGICCLISPLLLWMPGWIFLVFMMFWGLTVVADSPQFSTLVAKSAPAHNKGTALTIVTSVGFAITIVSIQVLKPLFEAWGHHGLLVLFIGPLTGLIFLKKYLPR